jgi:membrane protein implicated in regulation of membrane protease activity
MENWLGFLSYWHWLVLGVILVILEVFSPAAFFLWLGIAAGFVGLVLLVWPGVTWPFQVILFALFSLSSVVVGRRYLKLHPIATDEPALNRRGEQYVGRVFTLAAPVVNGQGKIRVDDTTWKISGTDCAAGTRVRVTGVDGVVLKVESEG